MVMMRILVGMLGWAWAVQAISPDNACTFHIRGSLFSLVYLQRPTPYRIEHPNGTVLFNFCAPFVPDVCMGSNSAYVFVVREEEEEEIEKDEEDQGEEQGEDQGEDQGEEGDATQQANNTEIQPATNESETKYECQAYSYNSYTSLIARDYQDGHLKITMKTSEAKFISHISIACSQDQELMISSVSVSSQQVLIFGSSKYGCPVFQVSSIWRVFSDNWIILGAVMAVAGFYLLFYGRATLVVTAFVATFAVAFGSLAAIATVIISPTSSTFVIYFAFVFMLFLSTILAYLVTRVLDKALFFVGAFLGVIIGVFLNSIFMSLSNIYTAWSLAGFIVLAAIPCGLLAIRYADPIVIVSTAVTGAYMVIRPISWMAGGFPNQFLVYHLVETGQLKHLPWTSYLYLVGMVGLAVVGAIYQFLKLHREQAELTGTQIQTNFIERGIEQPMDRIKQAVDTFIQRYRSKNQTESGIDGEQLGSYYKLQQINKQIQGRESQKKRESEDGKPIHPYTNDRL